MFLNKIPITFAPNTPNHSIISHGNLTLVIVNMPALFFNIFVNS